MQESQSDAVAVALQLYVSMAGGYENRWRACNGFGAPFFTYHHRVKGNERECFVGACSAAEISTSQPSNARTTSEGANGL